MRLYVEGGGNANVLRTACRRGFSEFLENAGFKGHMPRITACGSRADAYESFCTAVRSGEAAMLLVDSEAPVLKAAQRGDSSNRQDRDQWQPWLHLQQRQGDGWTKPAGSEDLHCHLMVQCMESWFLADREVLRQFFGQGFRENALPAAANAIEQVDKGAIYKALENATLHCKTKDAYGKGEHSFKLLALIDPSKVQQASAWALRFIESLKASMPIKP